MTFQTYERLLCGGEGRHELTRTESEKISGYF